MKENKNILIFSERIDGHYLEYVHHLHTYAILRPDLSLIFVLPQKFESIKDNFQWLPVPKVRFVFFENDTFAKLRNKAVRSLHIFSYVRKLAKEYAANEVFFIEMMEGFMTGLLSVYSKLKISGIIYRIYLYDWKKTGTLGKIANVMKYKLFSRVPVFKSLFILNDELAADFFNRKYKTNKFHYLPDPFMPLSAESIPNFREELNILSEKKIVLHIGALSERKGSVNILKSILLSEKSKLKNISFVFAGKVEPVIKDNFYNLLGKARKKAQIFIFDEFCSYEDMATLCKAADFILLPYLLTNHSSGIVGYAAQFGKPVVVPKQGLLGKLVRKNRLGILLPDASARSILQFIENADAYTIELKDNDYLKTRTITNFNKIIFNQFNV